MLSPKAVVTYLHHKVCQGWESSTKGSRMQNAEAGWGWKFCLGRLPREESALASPTSVLVKRHHAGTWPLAVGGPGLQRPQGCWRSPRPLPGVLHFQPRSLLLWPPGRWPDGKVAIKGNSQCSASLQHTVFLSSFLQYRRARTYPLTSQLDLSSASRQEVGWRNRHVPSLGLASCCSVTSQVVFAVPKWWMLSWRKPGSLSV